MKLVVATSNTGKLLEFQALLGPLGFTLLAQSSLGIESPPEPFGTFVENALAKARHAAQRSGFAALADDSGLCCDALDGAPGVHSARFAQMAEPGAPASESDRLQQDAQNNAHLLRLLNGQTQRGAHFHASLVLVRSATDPDPLIATGRWRGHILEAPHGENGFGYDALFLPVGHVLSAGQMAPEEKNQVSHRAQALRQLSQQWQARAR